MLQEMVFIVSSVVKSTILTASVVNDWKTWLTLVASLVSATVSIIGFFIQRKNHKEALKAQIIAKARIDWLKEVRQVFSQLIERSADYYACLQEVEREWQKSPHKAFKQVSVELGLPGKRSYFWSSLRLLETYFPDSIDGRNIKVIKTLRYLSTYLSQYQKKIIDKASTKEFQNRIEKKLPFWVNATTKEYYSKILKKMSITFANYLKEEWETAKIETIGK